MDFNRAINGPISILLGGTEYPVRPLKFKEWAPIQSWIVAHVPSPLARVARTLAELRDAGTPADDATEELLLDHAHRECLSWPPRPGSEAWIEALDGVEGGLTEIVRVVLRVGGTVMDDRELANLIDSIKPPDVVRLIHLAVYGIVEKKDEPGPTKTPPPGPEPTPVGAAPGNGWGVWRE